MGDSSGYLEEQRAAAKETVRAELAPVCSAPCPCRASSRCGRWPESPSPRQARGTHSWRSVRLERSRLFVASQVLGNPECRHSDDPTSVAGQPPCLLAIPRLGQARMRPSGDPPPRLAIPPPRARRLLAWLSRAFGKPECGDSGHPRPSAGLPSHRRAPRVSSWVRAAPGRPWRSRGSLPSGPRPPKPPAARPRRPDILQA